VITSSATSRNCPFMALLGWRREVGVPCPSGLLLALFSSASPVDSLQSPFFEATNYPQFSTTHGPTVHSGVN